MTWTYITFHVSTLWGIKCHALHVASYKYVNAWVSFSNLFLENQTKKCWSWMGISFMSFASWLYASKSLFFIWLSWPLHLKAFHSLSRQALSFMSHLQVVAQHCSPAVCKIDSPASAAMINKTRTSIIDQHISATRSKAHNGGPWVFKLTHFQIFKIRWHYEAFLFFLNFDGLSSWKAIKLWHIPLFHHSLLISRQVKADAIQPLKHTKNVFTVCICQPTAYKCLEMFRLILNGYLQHSSGHSSKMQLGSETERSWIFYSPFCTDSTDCTDDATSSGGNWSRALVTSEGFRLGWIWLNRCP